MKFKDLSTKEKIQHILEYYKFPIIAVVGGLFLIVWLSTSVYKNKTRVVIVNVSVAGMQINESGCLEIKDHIQNYFTDSGVKGEVVFDGFNLNPNAAPDVVMANYIKFDFLITERELDVVIGDKEFFEEYMELATFQPLEQYIGEGEGKINIPDEYKVYAKDPETGEEKVYAIKNDSLEFLSQAFFDKPAYVCLGVDCPNPERAIEVINELFNKN